MLPVAFRYVPGRTDKHPWKYDPCTQDLPLFGLSNADDCVVSTDDAWRARDTVWIRASSIGTLRFAELLLDAGCPGNQVREYALEGEAGYRSVAPMSAELRIFLPGCFAWDFDGDDVPPVDPQGSTGGR